MASTVVPLPRTPHWTRVEREGLVELGVFQPGERLEPLDGPLVVREPQGRRHAVVPRDPGAYRDAHPSGAALIVEIAESSYGVRRSGGARVRRCS